MPLLAGYIYADPAVMNKLSTSNFAHSFIIIIYVKFVCVSSYDIQANSISTIRSASTIRWWNWSLSRQEERSVICILFYILDTQCNASKLTIAYFPNSNLLLYVLTDKNKPDLSRNGEFKISKVNCAKNEKYKQGKYISF